MAYLALYRKWRPQNFQNVVGQKHVIRTLENSLKTGRISHAYLFSGPRGTGKTTVARLLAKGLDCANGPTTLPCDQCDECMAIANGTSLNVIEIDGASNRGIEEIRELREQVRYAPVGARYKVYIIDEIHMLTPEAFNALLKTLEEPPTHVVFIFATTDPHKVPATILSRCQRFDFKRLSIPELSERLRTVLDGENITAEDGVVDMVAKHAEGGMRDALGILEQCITYSDHLTCQVTAEVLGVAPQEEIETFVDNLMHHEQQSALEQINRIYNAGKDLLQFVRDVLEHLRSHVVTEEPRWDRLIMLDAIEALSQCVRDMRYAVDVRIPVELAVLRLSTQEAKTETSEMQVLKEKLMALESKLEQLQLQSTSGGTNTGKPSGKVTRPANRRTMKDDAARFDFIKDNWENYLQTLRSERLVQCEAFLRESSPVSVESGRLVVGFPRGRGFHKASIEQDKHREPAERVLSRFVGTSLKLECVFEDEVQGVDPETVPTADKPKRKAANSAKKSVAQPTDKSNKNEVEDSGSEDNGSEGSDLDDTVAAALRMFGGRVVKKSEQD